MKADIATVQSEIYHTVTNSSKNDFLEGKCQWNVAHLYSKTVNMLSIHIVINI